ncbi:hypothetical protein D3C78_1819930 [compost metagenome]
MGRDHVVGLDLGRCLELGEGFFAAITKTQALRQVLLGRRLIRHGGALPERVEAAGVEPHFGTVGE